MPIARSPIDINQVIHDDTQLGIVVSKLRLLLSETQGFHPVRHLLLKIADRLVAEGVCESHDVSYTIKQLLAENIRRGEISSRYIHRSLPKLYKRQYRQNRDLCSLMEVNNINQTISPGYTISRKGSISEIQFSVDTNRLLGILRIIFLALKGKNPCIRINFDLKLDQLIRVQIGDQDVVSGYPWFDLFRDNNRHSNMPLVE